MGFLSQGCISSSTADFRICEKTKEKRSMPIRRSARVGGPTKMMYSPVRGRCFERPSVSSSRHVYHMRLIVLCSRPKSFSWVRDRSWRLYLSATARHWSWAAVRDYGSLRETKRSTISPSVLHCIAPGCVASRLRPQAAGVLFLFLLTNKVGDACFT